MMFSVHTLIAVVAIIECLILLTFATYSWIESNSSLVIQNGPESSQVDTNTTKKMDITGLLTSTIDLNYNNSDFKPLNDFFSEVKYFEFAKATSSDGRTLFFPCRNNTYSTAGKYRKGDTIDYNTSFLYFDFVISNKTHTNGPAVIENRDVYFDDATGYTDIFTVSDGDSLTPEQKTAIISAMRMSITTQVGSSAPSTKIFSKNAYSGSADYSSSTGTGSYQSIGTVAANQSYAYDENGTGHTNNRDTWVTTNQLSKSVYHTTNNVIDADKLFVVRKNAETKVSFRVWFDVWDPVFRTAFGLDNLDYSQYESSEAAYWKIPDAKVGIKFRLKTSGNDLRSIYFDDYTFTNNTGINVDHLTDENPNYNVWFYAYQPYVAASTDHPERSAGYYKIKLERESRDATHTLWSANTATQSEMDYLMAARDSNNNTFLYGNAPGVSAANLRYQKSYFCYGDYDTNTAIYRWELPAAPVSDDYIFNAYSYMPNSSYTAAASSNGWTDCVVSQSGTKCGIGLWQDDASSGMTLLKFRDMATAVTTTNYNGGSNYQIMNAAAVADNYTHYLVYANNYNDASIANIFGADVAKITAAMYYDADEAVFKSYVPTGWLTGNTGVSFTYCPGGVFSANGAVLRWYNNSPQPLNDEYIYTALGSSNHYNISNLTGIGFTASFLSGSDGFLKGVGTWRDVELIKFSTELIDDTINSSYRYFIGISDDYSVGYYPMNPDASNMVYCAYIPSTQGATNPGINFVRMSAVQTSADNPSGPSAYWYANTRGTCSTFYPVQVVSTAADPAVFTRGFWNVSVLVDGTYENLIYDTLTDGAHVDVAGISTSVGTYAPIVTSGTTIIDDNGTPTEVNHDTVDYTPRDNYGLLQVSFDGNSWYTVCDDTTDTYSISDGTNQVYAGMIDRYRFYVCAESKTTVYWRWIPYAGYSVTFNYEGVSKTVNASSTLFDYIHEVTDASSTGIYKVVTEAPYIPVQAVNEPSEGE